MQIPIMPLKMEISLSKDLKSKVNQSSSDPKSNQSFEETHEKYHNACEELQDKLKP